MEFGKGIQADRMKNISPLILPFLMLTMDYRTPILTSPGFLQTAVAFLEEKVSSWLNTRVTLKSWWFGMQSREQTFKLTPYEALCDDNTHTLKRVNARLHITYVLGRFAFGSISRFLTPTLHVVNYWPHFMARE